MYGVKWDIAQSLMQNVKNNNQHELKNTQNLYVIILAVFFMSFGFSLAVSMICLTLIGVVIFFLSLPIPYLGNLVFFGIGIAFIRGGLRESLNSKMNQKSGLLKKYHNLSIENKSAGYNNSIPLTFC